MTSTSSRSKSGKRKSGGRRPAGRRATTNRRRSSGNAWLLWAIIGGLVVLFGVIAVLSRSGGPDITDAQTSGEALPLYEEGSDEAVGTAAPSFTGQTLDGEAISVEPGDGTAKAIVFLAHWCPHCQREVPVVQQWLDEGNMPEDVEMVAVATGIDRNRPNFPPHDWLEREDWQVPTVVDGDDAVRNAYGLATYPYWVLVDGDGNVVQRWSGETPAQQLDVRIGKLTGDQASG